MYFNVHILNFYIPLRNNDEDFSYQEVLHSDFLMVIQNTIERSVYAVIYVVHFHIHLLTGSHFSLGVDFTNQGVSWSYEKATRLGNYSNLFVRKKFIQRHVDNFRNLGKKKELFIIEANQRKNCFIVSPTEFLVATPKVLGSII